MTTHHFDCACGANEHTLRFAIDDDGTIYSSVYLNQYRSFWKRLWIGLKYIFNVGSPCRYGHWDCWELKAESVEDMKKLLGEFGGSAGKMGNHPNPIINSAAIKRSNTNDTISSAPRPPPPPPLKPVNRNERWGVEMRRDNGEWVLTVGGFMSKSEAIRRSGKWNKEDNDGRGFDKYRASCWKLVEILRSRNERV